MKKLRQFTIMCVKHVTYAQSLDDEIVFTAYSALYNGEAVCQGYAQLIYRILKQLGISVRVIPGYGKDKTVHHGWNIVKLGDYYYNLDATWVTAFTGRNQI